MAYRGSKIQKITQCALFAAIICALSPWCIMLGPVPITLSLFAVVFTGSVLPVKKAFAAVCVYILLGAVGLPVFSGFQGGAAALIGLTGGFIWSYAAVVFPVALSNQKSIGVRLVTGLSALGICYAAGTVQYMLVSRTSSVLRALAVCVAPFLIFDVIKIITALIIGKKMRILLKKQNLI